MDLFNAKALAACESRCNALERELGTTQGDLGIFKFLVRDMDTLLFKLSQCPDYSQMQPIIAQLCAGMEHRRKSESDRINSLINIELNKAGAI